jgi:riboflavin biosynthesis pyrimidine reductase
MAVMVQSIDGAAIVDGLSGQLGGDPDSRVFAALRRLPDAVLVAAGTARDEDYGPPRTDEATRAWRADRGLDPIPLIVVVSASLSLSPGARLFADGHRPLIVTTQDSPPERRSALGDVAEVVTLGSGRVDLVALLEMLAGRGVNLVMAEGGPSFNASLVAADLIDEWCLTIDPVVVGGDAMRIVNGGPTTPRGFSFAHVAMDEGVLLTRLLRDAPGTAANQPG